MRCNLTHGTFLLASLQLDPPWLAASGWFSDTPATDFEGFKINFIAVSADLPTSASLPQCNAAGMVLSARVVLRMWHGLRMGMGAQLRRSYVPSAVQLAELTTWPYKSQNQRASTWYSPASLRPSRACSRASMGGLDALSSSNMAPPRTSPGLLQNRCWSKDRSAGGRECCYRWSQQLSEQLTGNIQAVLDNIREI